MKFQEIKINNRYEHIVNYDNDVINLDAELYEALGGKEPEEQFVVSYEPVEGKIPLIAFQTEHPTANEFLLETDLRTDVCHLVDGHFSLIDNQQYTELELVLDFSYKDSVNASKSKSYSDLNRFKATNRTHTVSHLLEIEPAVDDADNVLAVVDWENPMGEKMHMLSLAFTSNKVRFAKVNVVLNLTFLRFGNHEETLSKTLVIYVAPPSMITDVILDFGSEASQMSVMRRGRTIDEDNKQELFTQLYDKYGDTEKDKLEYYQYDEASNKFYKSHFFIKKALSDEEVNVLKENGMNISLKANHDGQSQTDRFGDLIRFLTTKHDVQGMRNDYIVAPNVKLVGLGGITMPKVQVSKTFTDTGVVSKKWKRTNEVGGSKSYFYYRLGISVFLREALDEIVASNSPSQMVSFHILMPNIYTQSEIVEILQLLQIDVNHLLLQKKYERIKGFELTAVSESDASMMGVSEMMKNTQGSRPLNKGNYLLLDAGKGTLDFSLIHYEFRDGYHTYQNRWRSGIVGAGNSLTYAYLLALAHEYLTKRCKTTGSISDADVRHFIYYKVLRLGGDQEGYDTMSQNPAELLSLMRAVDKYKCYRQLQKNDIRNKEEEEEIKQAPLDKLELSGFLSWVESGIDAQNKLVEPVNDTKGYIKNMIDALVNETMNCIVNMQAGRTDSPDFKINYILFAGRAFRLVAFKNEMKRALEKRFDNLHEIQFTRDNIGLSMKDICLVCVNPLIKGTYNRKICSLPVLLQEGPESNEPENVGNQQSRECFISKVFKILTGKKETKSQLQQTNQQMIQKKAIAEILNFNSNISYHASRNGQKDVYVYNPENLKLNIGGQIYAIEGVDNEKVRLLFTGKTYKIRTASTLISCDAGMNFRTSSFVQSSFFPNIPVENQSVLAIPKVRNNWLPEGHSLEENVVCEANGQATANADGDSFEGINVSNDKHDTPNNKHDDAVAEGSSLKDLKDRWNHLKKK